MNIPEASSSQIPIAPSSQLISPEKQNQAYLKPMEVPQKIFNSFLNQLEFNLPQQASVDQAAIFYKDYCRLYFVHLFYTCQVKFWN